MSASVIVPDGATLRESMELFRDYINGQSSALRLRELRYAGDLDLVLREGREFRSVRWTTWRGRGYRRGVVRECFKNAHLLADRWPDLTYCEGFASSGFLPVHHAWCATEDGRVVEPTWRTGADPVERWEYLGVPFEFEWVDEWTTRRGCYGVLGDPQIYDGPLPEGAVRELAP